MIRMICIGIFCIVSLTKITFATSDVLQELMHKVFMKTPEELESLNKLIQRSEELEKKNHELALLSVQLKNKEKKLKQMKDELQNFYDDLQNKINLYTNDKNNILNKVIRAIEKMKKPQVAAQIIQNLDEQSIIDVTKKMREDALSEILNFLPEKMAAAIVEACNKLSMKE